MTGKRVFATSTVTGFAAALGIDPATTVDPIRMRIEGEIQQWAVLADQNVNTGDGSDIDTAPLDEKHNGEIRFIGEVALDSGVTLGFKVELDTNTDENQISESYVFVEHPIGGLVQIGDTDNAPINMHVGAPDGGIAVNDGDLVTRFATIV